MKLHQFRDLIAVAKTGSLRAAARELGLAQPVITRSIQELERELGVALFERDSKGVMLTESGKLFVRRVEAFQAELQRARDEIAQNNGTFQGQVSIALSPMICLTLMPRVLATFTKQHPDIVIKISETLFQPIEKNLEDGVIDFWIGPLDLSIAYPKFAVERLFESNRRVVGRKGHNLASAKSLADLGEARWVRPAISRRSVEVDIVPIFTKAGLPSPKEVIDAGSPVIAIMSVMHTNLLTMLPEYFLQSSPLADLIQKFEFIEPISSPPICSVRRHGLPLTPAAERLLTLMQKAAYNHIYDRKSVA